jgi:hypothetical protein
MAWVCCVFVCVCVCVVQQKIARGKLDRATAAERRAHAAAGRGAGSAVVPRLPLPGTLGGSTGAPSGRSTAEESKTSGGYGSSDDEGR